MSNSRMTRDWLTQYIFPLRGRALFFLDYRNYCSCEAQTVAEIQKPQVGAEEFSTDGLLFFPFSPLQCSHLYIPPFPARILGIWGTVHMVPSCFHHINSIFSSHCYGNHSACEPYGSCFSQYMQHSEDCLDAGKAYHVNSLRLHMLNNLRKMTFFIYIIYNRPFSPGIKADRISVNSGCIQ